MREAGGESVCVYMSVGASLWVI